MTLEKRLEKALETRKRTEVEKVFELIYNEYYSLVAYCVSRYLSSKEDIEEISNDVFIRFFNNLQKTQFSSIKYYLVQSAKNASINKIKKDKYETAPITSEFIIDDKIDDSFIVDEIKNILDETDYKIFIMYVLDDLTSAEIGERLSLSSVNVRKRYQRSLEKIRKEWNVK